MAGKKRDDIREKDISGLKYFDKLAPLLARLHDDLWAALWAIHLIASAWAAALWAIHLIASAVDHEIQVLRMLLSVLTKPAY